MLPSIHSLVETDGDSVSETSQSIVIRSSIDLNLNPIRW